MSNKHLVAALASLTAYIVESNGDAEVVAVAQVLAQTQQSQAPVVHAIDVIMEMLNDPRYTLRSLKSLAEKSGLTEGDVYYELDEAGIDYVRNSKRGSGAALVGLASRN